MAACPACGKENPDGFQFCGFCTAPLTGEIREQRKTVTVLFCDVTGSTALGESTDPEALRALLARYFERMKGIVESHGGTVEKFIGDAVMAVFGVPQAHEDDALRGCRAAVEMREALPELDIRGRIGVNTGEVVTGTSERLATGDVVNVAARFEQAAEPGEVLIGESTYALVNEAVEAELVDSLDLKGKSEPVPAYRLVAVLAPRERSHRSRFVGREQELDQIASAWVRAGSKQRCELVTVVGDAGVGKSRLVAEALAGIQARVVRGRCLPYGEGITYWPVVEVVKQLEALPSDPGAASSIRSLLRESDRPTSAEGIAWAFRKLLEEQGPLVVVFDDIQWAEETLLDLIEGVALFSSGASFLILCMARPELLERRRAWEVSVRLGPLPVDAVDELIGDQVTGELRTRIAAAAGGNPLFLTEMLAIAGEADEVEVPPTLRALLSARLDLLDPVERRVLECGSVEGELFHRGAVQALAPEEVQITPRLAALVRRELIRSDRALFPGDDGFRFRHLLIRDAAYESMSKSTRAELHMRFADWLEQHGAGLVELDEILGYHLEQAARNKRAVDRDDAALALAAADRLAAAGRRALWRGDSRAAANLLERSLILSRPNRLDIHLELDLAEAFSGTNPERALAIATETADRAAATGNAAGEALARACAASNAFEVGAGSAEELEALTLYAQPMLEEAGDHAGLVHVWRARYDLANARGRFEEWIQAAEQARYHSRLAGEQREQLYALAAPLVYGPRPADDALRTLDGLLPEIPDPWTLGHRAQLLAMLGRFGEAWPLAEHSNERLRQQGSTQGDEFLSFVAELAGDPESARAYRQARLQSYEERNVLAYVATIAPRLGLDLCALGRFAEAEPLAHRGRELGDEQDMTAQALWRQALARVRAHQGNHAEAEILAREAVEITERTDGIYFQANALADLAEVLAAAGRTDEAAQVMEHALERHERKKNLAMIAQVRPRLEALQNELAGPSPREAT